MGCSKVLRRVQPLIFLTIYGWFKSVRLAVRQLTTQAMHVQRNTVLRSRNVYTL